MAFDHSSFRRFGTWSCNPIPRDLPSSLTRHGVPDQALCPILPAFVAHRRRAYRRSPWREGRLSAEDHERELETGLCGPGARPGRDRTDEATAPLDGAAKTGP